MALYVMGYTLGRVWIEALRTDHAQPHPRPAAERLDLDHRVRARADLVPAARRLAAEREASPYATPATTLEADADGEEDPTDADTDVEVGEGLGRLTIENCRRSRPAESTTSTATSAAAGCGPTVFGMMDGLVSNFALIAGVAGAHASSSQVSLAGLAGLVGGAFSMAAGEYISVQSQNESTHAELDVERHELRHNADAELAELTQMYVDARRRPRRRGRGRRSSCPATRTRRC